MNTLVLLVYYFLTYTHYDSSSLPSHLWHSLHAHTHVRTRTHAHEEQSGGFCGSIQTQTRLIKTHFRHRSEGIAGRGDHRANFVVHLASPRFPRASGGRLLPGPCTDVRRALHLVSPDLGGVEWGGVGTITFPVAVTGEGAGACDGRGERPRSTETLLEVLGEHSSASEILSVLWKAERTRSGYV